jgi:hypothetical protein
VAHGSPYSDSVAKRSASQVAQNGRPHVETLLLKAFRQHLDKSAIVFSATVSNQDNQGFHPRTQVSMLHEFFKLFCHHVSNKPNKRILLFIGILIADSLPQRLISSSGYE